MFRITKRTVEALEARDQDYLVWDRDMRGFGVRIYPSGKRIYLVQYRTARRTRRVTIGQHGVLTADEARKMARQYLGDVARGSDASAIRQAKRRAPNVAGLRDRLLSPFVIVASAARKSEWHRIDA